MSVRAEPTTQVHDERHKRGFPVASPKQRRSAQARRLSRRAIKGPETVEAYLKGSSPPRYMQRLREIEAAYQAHRSRLEAAYLALGEACGHDLDLFSYRWRIKARAWPFEGLNELIREHNEWYPVETGLPMDPRTRDYVPVRGASYRRIELSGDWVLEHFPPEPRPGATGPPAPTRAPREPL